MNIEARKTKGATGLVGAFIGLMIVILIAVSVVLPVVKDTITNANLSGTEGTLANVIPLLIIVAVVLLVVGIMKFR